MPKGCAEEFDEVQGGILIPEADHTAGDYAYPVVADPTPSFGW